MNHSNIVKSGYVEFDRIANKDSGLITTGNIISNAVYGFHVRGYYQTQCNGFTFPVGELQAADLRSAKERYGREFEPVLRFIAGAEHFKFENGWVYLVRHVRESDKKVVLHGAVITSEQHTLLRRFDRLELQYGGYRQFQKSRDVMDSVTPLVSIRTTGHSLAAH